MEAATATPEAKQHFDAYQVLTDKIIAKLEKGIVPWQKLWDTSGQPRNLVTQAPYLGINALLLGMEDYEHNWFLSFEEVNHIGGKVKQGVKGHTVVRWEKNKNPKPELNGKDEFLMKLYTVFNVAQCDKVPEQYLVALTEKISHPSCEFVISAMRNPPQMQRKEPNAYYDVVEDMINLPKGGKKDMVFYANYFRQLVHCTGHDSRLARKKVAEMSELADRPLNSMEDLIADIGSCFLLSAVGTHTVFKNGAGYVQGWIDTLKQDKRFVVIAANQAQKAADYILNAKPQAEQKKAQQKESV